MALGVARGTDLLLRGRMAAVKTLDLTVFERIKLLEWLGQQQGDLAAIRRALPVLDALELSEQERREVEFVEHPGGRMTWKDADRTFTIELEDAQFDVLTPALRAQWPMARPILEMLEKLESASSD